MAPAYNESQNIAQFVEEWYPVVESHDGGGLSRLVVIDDGSKDDTYVILQELSRARPLLQPITKPNSGHGSTCIYGYKYALEHGAEYIFQTDTDGQTRAEEFEAFWALRNDYDAVLGKRPDRKDGAARVFISNVLRLVERVMFGIYIPDANVPYRLMKPELVAKYLPYLTDDLFLLNVMQTVCFVWFHENITFKDITFRPRQGGESFVNIKSIVKIGWRTVRDFLKLRKNLREAAA
ncbi:MAG: glycosyltransferase family 2 protein [Synergistaceae bacterium]|nr:glycosyltransferase family 2 protein [Synergistaceae bacterium]